MRSDVAAAARALIEAGIPILQVLSALEKQFPDVETEELEAILEALTDSVPKPTRHRPDSLTLVQKTQLATLVKFMFKALQAGQDLDEAKAEASGLAMPDFLLDLAVAEIEEKLGKIYRWPVGGVAETPNGRGWYTGPDSNSKLWLGLRERLEQTLDSETVNDVDEMSTLIVSRLPAPISPTYKGRGLVLGYVQSGKTTSFMSVAAKAADSGYRLIIVLSGVTNNLREQTQDRLEKVLTGDSNVWHWLTDKDADFTTTKNASNLLSSKFRLIAVVKKNRRRLQLLRNWLNSANQMTRENLPVLIIDDEADQASVNTAAQKTARSAVNKALVDLIAPSFLPKAAYVGYSATPFANLLIDTTDEVDLYPRDFVISLSKSKDYFGPERIFGKSVAEDDSENGEWDIIRDIPNSDVDLVRPPRKKNPDWKPAATQSLTDSIRWFLVATSIRKIRVGAPFWSSMMVHTSPNIKPHELTQELIRLIVDEWASDLKKFEQDCLDLLSREWSLGKDFMDPSIQEILNGKSKAAFLSALAEVLQHLVIVRDNYLSQDRLNYSGAPKPVIVIGGNTLSRGLTLEGLVSTYFLRTSSAYDSLLQMGRWFGYRKGYEDLQRIWLANDEPYLLSTWFRRLAYVEQEIREQIDEMTISGITPEALGIRIRQLPGMAITAAAKQRSAIKASLSYSGTQPQTILFSMGEADQKTNLDSLEKLALKLEFESSAPSGARALSVQSSVVIDFLREYKFPPNSINLQSDKLCEYIEKLNLSNELLHWNIAIYSNAKASAPKYPLTAGMNLGMANRSKIRSVTDVIDIKTLISVGDLVADQPNLKEACKKPDGTLRKRDLLAARKTDSVTKEKGLLGIYLIDPKSKPLLRESAERAPLSLEIPLVGLYFVFPETKNPEAAVFVTANLDDKAELEDSEVETVEDLDELEVQQ